MIRGLFFLTVVVLVAVAGIWMADRPGTVSVQWQGYLIETSVGVAAVLVAVLIVAAALLYRWWRVVRGGPRAWRRRWLDRRRRKGYEALSQGMLAVAAGDAAEAQRLARRAEALDGDLAMTRLLQAQAALLGGDRAAARRQFSGMLDHPDLAFLGLRGLLDDALRRQDRQEALTLARRAYELRPKTPWLAPILIEHEIRAGDYGRAREVVRKAGRRSLVDRATTARYRAMIGYLESLNLTGRAAEIAVQKAADTDPAFMPAVYRHIELMIERGQRRHAVKAIERNWQILPTAVAANLYVRAIEETDPLARLKRIERLAAQAPDHIESLLVVASAALEARLWGHARRQLDAALAANPTRRVCRMFADLEDAEHGDNEKVRYWLARAADAPVDAAWACSRCGTRALEWDVTCPSCDGFDSQVWRRASPAEGVVSAILPAASTTPPSIGAPAD